MEPSKRALIAAATVAAALGGFLVAPVVTLALVAVFAALLIGARRNDRPIATEAADWGERWYIWLASAAGLFLVGFSMLLTSKEGDLSAIAWAVWIISWLAAAIGATVGLALGAVRFMNQRRA